MKKFKFTIDGKEVQAIVEPKEAGVLSVTINENTYNVEVPELTKQAPRPVIHHAAAPAPVFTKPIAAAPVASNTVAAPLPGTITKVLVKEGDKVKKGDTLITMEAMKMENSITAEADGIVRKVHVTINQSVNQGDPLVDFEGLALPKTAPADAPAPQPTAAPTKPVAVPAGANTVTAPLPGTITKIEVKEGQQLNPGDTVVVMEAMKMENNITTEFGGTVKTILVQQGQQVQNGQALVEMA